MQLNQNDLRQTFKELIEINSYYPDDLAVQRYVTDRLNKAGLTFMLDDFGNIITPLPGNDQPPVLLNTHIDIPEDTPKVEYRETPEGFEGTGKTILGADPKTGLAVLIELAIALAKDEPARHAPIDFVFTRGEERGLLGATSLDMTKVRARTGLVIDEDGPANVGVVKAPGMVKFEGEFIGKIAHSREPWLGSNALQMAAEAMTNAPLGYTDESKRVTWNVGLLQAGTAINSVPGSVAFVAEMRSFNGELLQTEAQRIKNIFTKAAEKYGGNLEATIATLYEPYELNADDPLRLKVTALLKELDLTFSPLETYGASDANVFNARGLRCMAIGSGYYNAHQYIERADLADMEQLAQFLDTFVRN